MKLTNEAIEAIRASQQCRNRLQFEMECSSDTIYRYVRDNSIMLTTALAIQIIEEETGLKREHILEQSSPITA